MADAGALQAAQEDPARTSQLLAEAKAAESPGARKSAPRVSAASRPLSAGRGARPSRPSGSAAPATPPAPPKPATPVAKPATPPPAAMPPPPPSPTPQPAVAPSVASPASPPPAGASRKGPTVRYADLEAAEGGAAPAPPPPFAPRSPPVASPTRNDSVVSDYSLPLRVAPDWARNGGASSAPGRSVSQLSAAPSQPAAGKRADLEAAVAATTCAPKHAPQCPRDAQMQHRHALGAALTAALRAARADNCASLSRPAAPRRRATRSSTARPAAGGAQG